MKKIGGITVGGLQQRIFNLMLVFILALVGAYMAVSAYQAKNLERIVREAETGQQASIAAISEETMHAVLQGTLKKSTALQAYIAGDLFGDVKTDVLTLQTLAEEIFAHAEGMPQHAVSGPKAENDGAASVMALHEAGAGGGDSEALGLAANMSEVMLSMFANSEKLSSCFVATPDGNLLIASDRAGNYIDEDGRVRDFPVRERPWYRQAAEAGELIFTGVEEDAYSGIPGLVCAAPVYVGGELKAVVGADIFLDAIRDYVEYASTEGSFLCIVNRDGQVLFSPVGEGVFRPALSSEAPDLRQCGSPELADFVTRAMEAATELEQVEAEGKEYYMAGVPIFSVGWTLLSVVDRSLADLPAQAMLGQYDEISAQAQGAFETGAKHSQQTALVLTLTVLALALVAALYVASRVVKPVELMTRRIRAMRGENLQFQMEKAYRTGDEIEELAESFAKLSGQTLQYIAEVERVTAEKERIGTELELATRIQADMLPNIFPAYPERSEFDIYAKMDPAREVGGDFYDFFLVDEDHLCMVMADVSGKGVPAALFMMATRIILSNNAKQGKSPAQILEETNAAICANNREEMFVTVWIGVLELSTGKLTAANAGHEYPALRRPGGGFELVEDPHGFVLGGLGGMKYREYELTLEPGSKLFVYTDGVPEATDAEEQMFGTERMMEALNREPERRPEEILAGVRAAVDAFVGEAEQFDDLTMLCVEYRGMRKVDF